MGKIRLIDGFEKIAAGEVIERPASVVKELIENSIDADASQIFFTIIDSGKTLIQVVDNGKGIDEPDVEIAFRRHTSSKIQSADELDSLHTLGFRGEALASIAAVSQIELITRPASQGYAVSLKMDAGKLVVKEESGGPAGTNLKIKNLFFNLPVRLKFMKSKKVELGHITDIVSRYALAYPAIHFKLEHNGVTLINSPKWGGPAGGHPPLLHLDAYGHSIQTIYGKRVLNEMIPIEYEEDELYFCGYIGKPEIARSDRTASSLFVNRRLVTNKGLSSVIESAFEDFLMRRKYPFYVMFIELPPNTVDFNIHPSKKLVNFLNEVPLLDKIRLALNVLVKSKIIQSLNDANAPSRSKQPPRSEDTILDYWSPPSRKNITRVADSPIPHSSPSLHQPAAGTSVRGGISPKQTHFRVKSPGSAPPHPSHKPPPGSAKSPANLYSAGGVPDRATLLDPGVFNFQNLPTLTKLNSGIQAHDVYLIFQTDDELVIIDQHAAHERINYEKVTRDFDSMQVPVQELIVPIKMDVPINEVEFIKESLPKINEMGFDIEHFGGETFIIRKIPVFLKELSSSQSFIIDTCRDLLQIGKGKLFQDIRKETIQYLACHMSITKGDEIWSQNRIKKLLEELDRCDNPHFCAHGRPTYIKIAYTDLDKWFHRIV